jgi:hypothetical protein
MRCVHIMDKKIFVLIGSIVLTSRSIHRLSTEVTGHQFEEGIIDWNPVLIVQYRNGKYENL